MKRSVLFLMVLALVATGFAITVNAASNNYIGEPGGPFHHAA